MRDEGDTLPGRFGNPPGAFQRLRHWEIGWSSKTKRCRGSGLDIGPGGLPKTTESTVGRVCHSPHSPSVPVVTKEGVPVGVASVGASSRGLPRQNESRWVELVLGLHHGDSKDKMCPSGWSECWGFTTVTHRDNMSPDGWS
jgi:hypothetical protein